MTGPGMRRLRWSDLAIPFVVLAILGYALFRSQYDSLPPLGYAVPLPIAADATKHAAPTNSAFLILPPPIECYRTRDCATS